MHDQAKYLRGTVDRVDLNYKRAYVIVNGESTARPYKYKYPKNSQIAAGDMVRILVEGGDQSIIAVYEGDG